MESSNSHYARVLQWRDKIKKAWFSDKSLWVVLIKEPRFKTSGHSQIRDSRILFETGLPLILW